MSRLGHSPATPSLLLSTCRRAAAAALHELAGKISEPEQTNRCASFAQVHHDDIIRMPESTLCAIALPRGGRAAFVPRPGTGIVELMSEDTYLKLYQAGLDNWPHRRRSRLQPFFRALAEGFAALAGSSGSAPPTP